MRNLDRRLAEVLSRRPAADRSTLAESVRTSDPLIDGAELHAVVDRAWQRAHGLGPVADVMSDPAVTEVMINGPGPVWLDREGRMELSDLVLDATDIALLIERILDPLGLRVDRVSPLVDARLPDGSRVNVVLPPLAVDGPIVTIRRFGARPFPMSSFGPPEVVGLLEDLVAERRTIVVSGGTGAGKTTLLNTLGSLLDAQERVLVIEDTCELRFPGRQVLRLEARPANSEGIGEVSIRDLVRNGLRMRPDRIVVGEVRGGEALDLLLALNTGHTGSLSTCHANDPAGAVERLRNLALMGGVELPPSVVEAQIAAAVDVIVQVVRDGKRRMVSEVASVGSQLPLGVRCLWRAERC